MRITGRAILAISVTGLYLGIFSIIAYRGYTQAQTIDEHRVNELGPRSRDAAEDVEGRKSLATVVRPVKDQPLDAGSSQSPLVRIYPDGKLVYGPNYKPDLAAQEFWAAAAKARHDILRGSCNGLIDTLLADNSKLSADRDLYRKESSYLEDYLLAKGWSLEDLRKETDKLNKKKHGINR